jgi:predicted Zn-dependent protease
MKGRRGSRKLDMFVGKIVIIFLIVFVPFIGFAKQLPDLGSPLNQRLTPQREQKLGQQFIHLIRQRLPIIYDPVVNEYVQSLGNRLVVHSNQPLRVYHFFIVNNPEVNAFSGPDGYIGINSGLLFKVRSVGELAAVMSHEIAHVSQLHIARLLSEQKTLRWSTIVTMLVALAVGTQYPTAALGLMTASNAGQYQHVINFSRKQENEADRIGMQILKKAGFDLCGVTTFFNRVNREDQLNKTEIAEMFRTHPTTETRLAEVYYRSQPCKPTLQRDLEFKLVQARLSVNLAHDPHVFIRQSLEQLDQSTFCTGCCVGNNQCCVEKTRLQYVYALALLKAGYPSRAKKQMDALLKQFPNQVLFKMTRADIEEKLGDHQVAYDVWSSLYQSNLNRYAVLVEYANFLLREQKFQEAVRVLKPYDKIYRDDEVYLMLLSEAQGRGGDLVSAYQTRARVCLLNGSKQEAKEQLEMALHFVQDLATKNRIQIKLSELK